LYGEESDRNTTIEIKKIRE